jgi:microcin C transport system permease protein
VTVSSPLPPSTLDPQSPATPEGAVLAPARIASRFMGVSITPLTVRRLQAFRRNARGFWSLWLFLVLFGISLFAEFIANDRPLIVSYDGELYFPVLKDYPETVFGGEFERPRRRRRRRTGSAPTTRRATSSRG